MKESELRKLFDSLSLEEKIGEMQQIPGEYFVNNNITATGENNTLDFPQEVIDVAGSTLNVRKPEHIMQVQKEHIERHPHHIPMLFMLDIIHGFHTTFPVPLAQACSFEPELVSEMASVAAEEACASGIHVTFSPMVDLSRDARWGRVTESSGEDPYLNAKMAEAAVKGYQGDDLSKEGKISACVKHFAAYGGVEGGREYGSVDVSERSLRQYFLPSYKAACDAGAGMLMCAFNAIAGVPATADKHLMRDILRDEWGFDGAVITDYGSLNNMQSHGISDSDVELSRLAANAGVDIEMCITRYIKGLPALAEKDENIRRYIDESAWRILKLKNRLGLFEDPYHFGSPEKLAEKSRTPEHLALAREAVSHTSVLLKNENDFFPLKENAKIAFIGPYVSEKSIHGSWTVVRDMNDPSFREVMAVRYPNAPFTYADGCYTTIGEEEPSLSFYHFNDFENDPVRRKAMLEEAVETAKNADIVIMMIGEHPRVGGELSAKAFLDIPKIQRELFDAVSAVNENLGVVLYNHRPIELRDIAPKAKAILDVWFPGSCGSDGIVDMLFGKSAPTGRLTMSFPYTVGQEPLYYNHLPTDHSPEFVTHFVTGYVDCQNEPFYPFGHGLTYTSFSYGETVLDKAVLHEGETLSASVKVTNTGKRDGYETVQLYIRDPYASVSRPVKELRGFKKVFIKAGETVNVTLPLSPDDLRFYNVDLDYVWEPGEIRVYMGHDSTVSDYKSFVLE